MLIDYNLYGMNMLNCGAVKFRRNGDEYCGNSQSPNDSFTINTPTLMVWDKNSITS